MGVRQLQSSDCVTSSKLVHQSLSKNRKGLHSSHSWPLAASMRALLFLLGAASGDAYSDCPADLTGDSIVNGSDLAAVLSSWGLPGGDITGDGTTNGTDLSALLSGWGNCPPPEIDWTLVTTTGGSTTTAVDASGAVTATWTAAGGGASVGYLRSDGSLVRPTIHAGGAYPGAAHGGRIQIFGASGALLNDLIVSTSEFQQHHDIRPMPNGNILCIVWEGHTQAQGLAAGRTGLNGALWSESILEIHPTGSSSYEIVWRWNLWDHLIQDANSSLANYGVVSQHPELVDINLGTITSAGDWIHMNSIDYSASLDQIVVSSRTLNEVWVIDHSTTTAQAASHAGGARGHGGDLLYRWGNPANYDRGAAGGRWFFVVHSATWIRDPLPGAGNILAFNNGDRGGTANDYSTVMEIVPPRDGQGAYTIDATSAFGPAAPVWTYGSPGQIYGGPIQCGAFRTLDNTTLITLTNSGRVFEVDAAGTVVASQDSVATGLARAPRYKRVDGVWLGP